MPVPKVPVLLIAFNRPDLAKQVFEAIRHYRPERFYLAVDGPRDPSLHPHDEEKTRECRKLVERVDWPCEVFTRFSNSNQGCGRGVSNAITWMFEREQSGVILEDDCVPAHGFFAYCAALLGKYADHPDVMHVSGNNFASDRFRKACSPHSYGFTRYADLWGWATWSRAWKHFQFEVPDEKSVFLSDFVMEGVDRYRRMAQRDRVLSTRRGGSMWGYQWQYAVYKMQGICIAPAYNQVSNIGFGVDATHTSDANTHAANCPTSPMPLELNHPSSVEISPELNKAYADNTLGTTGRYRKRYLKRWLRSLLIPGYQPKKW